MSYFVLKHIFVNAEVTVGIKVVVNAFFHGEEVIFVVQGSLDLERRVSGRSVFGRLVGMILHTDLYKTYLYKAYLYKAYLYITYLYRAYFDKT